MAATDTARSAKASLRGNTMSELYQDRLLGGIVKAGNAASLEQAQQLLAIDIEIVAPAERVTENDLWPCIWALCACLERQFSGTIHVNCGLGDPLTGPISLAPRCSFGTRSSKSPLRIFIGQRPDDSSGIWGDARQNAVSYQRLLQGDSPANVVACFGLAGYLGYAALGVATGLPHHREVYLTDVIAFIDGDSVLPDEISCIGLGQLGQAYLALLFFATARSGKRPKLTVLDRDRFELPNGRTQLLLANDPQWVGEFKADYIAKLTQSWQWDVQGVVQELHWGWKRPREFPGLALLGLDDLEVRRMAAGAGFDWIVDSGVGTSLAEPRITWYQLPPEPALAKNLFRDARRIDSVSHLKGTELHRQLMETPGGCGWVTFGNINATAPSMGLVAAAYAVSELSSPRTPIAGTAYLWSPLLPFLRECLN